jgi:hypothetical protein
VSRGPERADQIANRKRKARAGGRPVSYGGGLILVAIVDWLKQS